MEPFSVLKSVKLSVSTFEVWSNGIIYFKLNDNAEITLEEAKAHFELLKSVYDGKNKVRVLVEPGRYTSISNEAREFSTLPESNTMTAANAVIVKSLAHRIVINFIISFNRKQKMKMRMFESKEKAIEWLLSVKI